MTPFSILAFWRIVVLGGLGIPSDPRINKPGGED